MWVSAVRFPHFNSFLTFIEWDFCSLLYSYTKLWSPYFPSFGWFYKRLYTSSRCNPDPSMEAIWYTIGHQWIFIFNSRSGTSVCKNPSSTPSLVTSQQVTVRAENDLKHHLVAGCWKQLHIILRDIFKNSVSF